jgi:hypothetical protein
MGCGSGHQMDMAVADRESRLMRSGVEGSGKAIHPETADGGWPARKASVYKRILRLALSAVRRRPNRRHTTGSGLQAVG